MNSSSRNDEMEQLRTAADNADAALLKALPWIILLVIAAVSVYFLYTALQRKWFRSRAAYRTHTCREEIGKHFGLTIRRVSRDGKIVISPGETEKWQRRGLEAELAQFLRTSIKLSSFDGYVVVKDAVKTPGYLPGRARFSATTGEMLIGVDTESGEPARITLREKSGFILAGKPGSGKTVFLNQLIMALMTRSEVVAFDGKKDDPEKILGKVEFLQDTMKKRLEKDIDYWRRDTKDRPKLLLLVLDEAQTWFSPASTSKRDKTAAAERETLVRDLIQRGRSAGVLVVLATQRMTADIIPSGIRDICGVKMVGRVTRPEDSQLVLGVRPGEGEPDPLSAKPGQFVVDDEAHPMRMVQVYGPR
ncbi:FtsK/SpoIIIE domain-containing protein [Corynebacterium yonathiae]|uniref:FtsK/SpoIIIE domain-containing protein n=1 Tax=Corynebacterium yonathiae TaxID=2913504 RepID=A0ABU8Y7E9_9CORY